MQDGRLAGCCLLVCGLAFSSRALAAPGSGAIDPAASFATADSVPIVSLSAAPSREPALGREAIFTSRKMGGELLQKARAANDDLYSALKSFVCQEQIQRFKGDFSGRGPRPIDTITANLSFESGVEHYFDIHQNARTRNSLSSLAGAWSEGEFGTLLQQTKRLLGTQDVSFREFSNLDGQPAAIYRFEVAEEDSPWDLAVAGQHYHLPFQTDVWISASSGEILRIARVTLAIPEETRITEIQWNISLQPAELNGRQWLLPKTGEYAVMYRHSNRREWNQMSFSNYRRYGSEVSLRFDAIP